MSESIISLCYVNKEMGGTVELCRIADYENGWFTPYKIEPKMSYANHQDLIYGGQADLNVIPEISPSLSGRCIKPKSGEDGRISE